MAEERSTECASIESQRNNNSSVRRSAPAVFVSYASEDAKVALAVCKALEASSLLCWMAPRDVRPGAHYAEAIVEAINVAKVLVLVLSANSIASPHVGREVERAASKGRAILGFRIDAAPFSSALEYFLSNSQWIDVTQLGFESALSQLTDAISRAGDPSGLNEQNNGTAARSKYSTKKRSVNSTMLLALAVGGALLGGIAAKHFWPKKPDAGTTASDKSIAVLPFADMSEKQDQEYFADGVAEEILDKLANLSELRVIGRTSSFQFKGHNQDLRAIGTQLGVTYILQGSVRKTGDQIRVTAQLIDSRNGSSLMSETYDRRVGDVLRTQDEITASLARALQIEVDAESFGAKPALHSPEAYMLYLRGRRAFDRFDQQGFEQAANDFERAYALDPSLANAATFLAFAYDAIGEFGFMSPTIAFERARKAAQNAERIDPKLFGPHVVLGDIHLSYDWDWTAAENEVKRAGALGPHHPEVLFLLAKYSLTRGYLDEGLKQINEALSEDPLAPHFYMALNWIQTRRGKLTEAASAVRRTLEISPTYSAAHYYLGMTLLAGGKHDDALAEFKDEIDEDVRLAGLAMAYYAIGRKAESDLALAAMLKKKDDSYAFGIAEVYGYRGEAQKAVEWLEHAYASKDASLFAVRDDPPFKTIKSDARFKEFLRKMKLDE